MKWYSMKKFKPAYDGKYIVRSIDNNGYPTHQEVLWDGRYWMDYDRNDHLHAGNITHFCIPDPIEIEE